MGRFRTDLISPPYPLQSPEDKRPSATSSWGACKPSSRINLDPDEVDRTGDLPKNVIEGLAKSGCWGMKIPKEYGGLGLSQINYNRAVALVASYCGSTAKFGFPPTSPSACPSP